MPSPSGSGLSGCLERSQFMSIQVQIQNDRVAAASFQTFGCAGAIACGSYLTEWMIGRLPSEAVEMSPARLERDLGGLPVSRRFCASLAVDALRAALAQATGGCGCS